MRRLGRTALVLLASAAPALAAPPPAASPAPPDVPPTGGRPAATGRGEGAITPTRTAVEFSGRERALVEAIQKKDGRAIEEMLDPEFALRAADHPAVLVPRDDWQEAVYAAPPETFRVSETAVHMMGEDTAVVSFAYEQEAKAGPTGRFLFVDVWRRKEGAWRLAVRYAAPASEGKVPGWAIPAGQVRKTY